MLFNYLYNKKKVYTLALGLFLGVFNPSAQAEEKAICSKEALEEVLRNNPDILEKALKAAKKNSKKQNHKSGSKAQHKIIKKLWSQVYDDHLYPVLGNPTAPYKVVGFFEPNCQSCHRMLKDMMVYVQSHPDVRVIMREFPFLSEESNQLARLTLIAYQRGKLQEFLQEALTRDEDLSPQVIEDLSKKFKLNNPLQKDEEDAIHQAIENTKILAKTLKINTTPTIIVKAKVYEGSMDMDAFDKIITKKLRDAKKNNAQPPQPEK